MIWFARTPAVLQAASLAGLLVSDSNGLSHRGGAVHLLEILMAALCHIPAKTALAIVAFALFSRGARRMRPARSACAGLTGRGIWQQRFGCSFSRGGGDQSRGSLASDSIASKAEQ